MEEKQMETQPTNEGVKTFTQDEVNDIVKNRLAKEKKKYPSQDDLDKYQEWKENQKTLEEKQNEQIRLLQQERDKALSELSNHKRLSEVLNKDIKKEFSKFVVSEVNSLVTEEKDFNTALNEYVEKNPQYLKKEEAQPKVKVGKQSTRADVDEITLYKRNKYKNNPYFKK